MGGGKGGGKSKGFCQLCNRKLCGVLTPGPADSLSQHYLQTGGPLPVQQCMPVHALLHPALVLSG